MSNVKTIPQTKRNLSLDFLRFLGVLVIIFAHTHPPDWIDQIRNFGTPLLIVASAATYAYIYQSRHLVVGKFLQKRMYRLLIPVWTFLTFFFGTLLVFSLLTDKPFPFRTSTVAESYLLYQGIGYVWIFKVYLYLAFLTPLLLAYSRRMTNNLIYYGSLVLIFIVYTVISSYLERVMSESAYSVLADYVLTIFPYAGLYGYGMRMHQLGKKTILAIAVISGLISFGLAIYLYQTTGAWVLTQAYKYPPQLYYLSYAFMWVNILYIIAYSPFINRIPPKIMKWLSENSLWIYLWHICAVFAWDRVIEHDGTLSTSLIKFVLIFTTAIALVLVQNKVTDRVEVLRFFLHGDEPVRRMKKVA